MAEHQSILALARLGWSYRRIAAEVGVDRATVSRHVRAARGDPPDSNAAISIAGSLAVSGMDAGVADAGTGDSVDPNAAISITGSGHELGDLGGAIAANHAGFIRSPSATLPATPAGRRSRCEPLRAGDPGQAGSRPNRSADLVGSDRRARLYRLVPIGAAIRSRAAVGHALALPADGATPALYPDSFSPQVPYAVVLMALVALH